jgi:hypothetical protein
MPSEIEELDSREYDDYAGDEFEELNNLEEVSIMKMREEEKSKSFQKKEEQRIS